MYAKSIIKLLAEHGRQSIYSIAKALGVSEGSIYPSIVALRREKAVSMDNQLTEFGWRLYQAIQAVGEMGVNQGEFVRRFGLDVAKALKRLKIIEEKPQVYVERKLWDPPNENKDVTIIDEKEDLPKGLPVKGVICPHDHWIPVEEAGWPTYLTCPECGEELKHMGNGTYVPRCMTKESPLEFLPILVGGLAPVLFGLGCIVACELFKTKW